MNLDAVREPSQEIDYGAMIRVGIGAVLLGFGVIVAIWVLSTVFEVLNAEAIPPLVKLLTPDADKAVEFGLPEGKFSIPPEFFAPLGYLLVCFLLSILVGVSIAAINGGASLLQPDTTQLLRQLIDQLHEKQREDKQ